MPFISDVRNKINSAIRNAVGTGEIVPVAHANVLDDPVNNDGVLQYVDARTKRQTGVLTSLPDAEPGWGWTGAVGRSTILDFGNHYKIVHLKWVLTRTAGARVHVDPVAKGGLPTAIRPPADIYIPVVLRDSTSVGGSARFSPQTLLFKPNGDITLYRDTGTGSTLQAPAYTVYVNATYSI